MTFSQPVEVPGKILPAGTYTFEMHDSGMNRHVIQIMDQGGSKLVALVLAIPTYRAKATERTSRYLAAIAQIRSKSKQEGATAHARELLVHQTLAATLSSATYLLQYDIWLVATLKVPPQTH